MRELKQHKGFTLIELLVVIAIIGILASVVLASLNSARERARENALIAQVEEISKAAELYNLIHGSYGTTGGSGDDLNSCSGTIDSSTRDTMFGINALDDSVKNLVVSAGDLRVVGARLFCYVRSDTNTWAFAALLQDPGTDNPGRAWCTDSSGSAKEITITNNTAGRNSLLTGTTAICP